MNNVEDEHIQCFESKISLSKLFPLKNVNMSVKCILSTARPFCNFSLIKMSSHIDRTQDQTRARNLLDFQITEICNLSPTVKSLTLQAKEPTRETFKPGQWVDFNMSGLSEIGGFSLCSPPRRLESKGEIVLAVKQSNSPPALWVHGKAKVGDWVRVRFGGDFYYPNAKTESNPDHNLLLVAGGVGINPIYSIAQYVHELKESGIKTSLLYSAKTESELIFRPNLDRIASVIQSFQVRYFITSTQNRISRQDLSLDKTKETFCYICGPDGMIRDVEQHLFGLGVDKEHVYYERWW